MRSSRYLGPQTVLALVILAFGVPMAVAIPVGGGFDEETHTIRAWEIATLNLIPNAVPRNERPYPAILWNLSFRRQLLVRPVPPTFWSEFKSAGLDAQGYIYSELPTRSVYSPFLLAPHALGIRYLGFALRLPALVVVYGSRMLGLLAYGAAAWASVRIAPFGKWTMAVLLAAPTAVMHAATINADPVSNALGFLFLSGVLATSGRQRVSWADGFVLASLMALLFLGKVNMASFALLPFLLIQPRRFGSRYGYPFLVGLAILLGVVLVGGWAIVAYPHLPNAPSGADPLGQMRQVLSSPLRFVGIALAEIARNGVEHLKQWIAVYGYGYGVVPTPVYVLYPLAILMALLADGRAGRPPERMRRGLMAVALIGVGGTILAMYAAVTPVGSGSVEGVQGRYFAVALAAGLLALVGVVRSSFPKGPAAWAGVFGGAALATYLAGMVLSYHVPCGASYYSSGLCFQPVYKNFAPQERLSPPVGPGYSVVQQVIPECDGLSAVRLWVDSSGAEEPGRTWLVVRDPTKDVDLARLALDHAELPSLGWQDLRFEPEWSSRGKLYLLVVAAEGSQSEGPRLALSLRPEYPEVDLAENGTEVDYDLVFQYGCVAGWQALLRGPNR